jgi:1-deoxyxylulose-5-phosphate synthase
MEISQLGRSGLFVSRLALGAMNFGTRGWGCDERAAGEIVTAYRDAGGNFFDTADVYAGGQSEQILGRLLRGARDAVVIASKVGFPTGTDANARGLSAKHIKSALHATLIRLDTDYVDLYQMHHFDARVPLEETLQAFDDFVRAGLVRYVGCSNFFAWQVAHAIGVADTHGHSRLVSAQMMYNLVRRDVEREHLSCSAALGVGIIAYSPLHGGTLATRIESTAALPSAGRAAANPDVYLSDSERLVAVNHALMSYAESTGVHPVQLALGWITRNPAISTVLIAGQTAAELRQQLQVLDLDIDNGVWASLDAATSAGDGYPKDFYDRLAARRS